jgi:hypothetical protein
VILGKLTVRIENINQKYMYCRPVSDGLGRIFPSRIGIAHVVFIERSELTDGLNREDLFTCYGIFNTTITEEEFQRGFIRIKVSPITEEIFNALTLIYPQKQHPFSF